MKIATGSDDRSSDSEVKDSSEHAGARAPRGGDSEFRATSIALLLLALCAAFNFAAFSLTWKPQPTGDYIAFYSAGKAYLTQPGHTLFDSTVQAKVRQDLFGGTTALPFYHLPYELLIFAPLAKFSYVTSLWIWRVLSVGLLGLSAFLLGRLFRLNPVLLFVGMLAFYPVVLCLFHGQDSILLLTIYSGCFLLYGNSRLFWAGAVLALGLFKLHLVLPIAAVLLLRRQWRAVAGFSCSAVVLLAISTVMVGTSGIQQLAAMILSAQQSPSAMMGVNPVMMANLRGLTAMLVSNTAAQRLITLAVSTIALGLAVLHWRNRGERLATVSVITATTLVSYHLNPHDLSLMFIPVSIALTSPRGVLARSAALLLCCTPLFFIAVLFNFVPLFVLPISAIWYGMWKVAQQPPPTPSNS